MKVTKTSTQPTFQPIEIKITIESEEELFHLKALKSCSADIRETLYDSECLEYYTGRFLESMLEDIGESL